MTKTLLRWSLALVLGAPAVALAWRSHHAPLVALGILEALGAALLLPARTRRAGAGMLLASLVLASAYHAHAGEWPPTAFLVYGLAIVLVAKPVVHAAPPAASTTSERTASGE